MMLCNEYKKSKDLYWESCRGLPTRVLLPIRRLSDLVFDLKLTTSMRPWFGRYSRRLPQMLIFVKGFFENSYSQSRLGV